MTKHSPERSPERIQFARDQRQTRNEFSQLVWQFVRAGRMLGEKFRREVPFGPYTLDFVCLELKLDIEVDGADHFSESGKKHDEQRDAYLYKHGFEVLRIAGFRLLSEAGGVRNEIEALVKERRNWIESNTPAKKVKRKE